MEWGERNGPWNFDNNLLLLCRWRKGLSITNISFTHSPFWIQVWGLPFESMTEEVGRDLGNKLGKYIESDRQSWSSEQAKFMWIRVDIPIDKPLRKGGNIVNSEGDKYYRLHLNTKGFPISALFVEFWVLMRSIVLGIKVNLKATGNMGTGFE